MDKTQAINIINNIKENQSFDSVVEALEDAVVFIILQPEYNHQKTMEFLEASKSNKLGGSAIYLNKALETARLQLKQANKTK